MQLFNTLTRNKENFAPGDKKSVSIYTCGLTVYSQPHIGNWVSYIYWDVLIRTLKAQGLSVNRVQNITDVGHLVSDDDDGEDKMEKGARNESITAWDVAEKYIQIADKEAYEQLGLLRPDHMPRATDYIDEQINFIKQLEAKDTSYTYEIPGDGIYFDTSKLPDYGKLARLDIEGLEAGKRVENQQKRNKTDFALWKFSPKGVKRDMEWESPWGVGFPGWHLECSVMARELLGDTIDIHTGGVDHIPVHHTNEIAQSEALTSQPFARVWLHNNHLLVDGKKMSKSLGNIYTLQDIQDKGYDLAAFKLLILSSHYQTSGNFTWEIMDAAQNSLNNLRAFADLMHQPKSSVKSWLKDMDNISEFSKALFDNLHTPYALSLLSGLSVQAQERLLNEEDISSLKTFLSEVDSLLGFDLSSREDISEQQKTMLTRREEARSKKDWETSDKLRAQLLHMNIELRDTPHGQVWHRK